MAFQFIGNIKGDMEWLFRNHLTTSTPWGNSAVIWGSMDCPEKIEVYEQANPQIKDKPRVFILTSGNWHKEII